MHKKLAGRGGRGEREREREMRRGGEGRDEEGRGGEGRVREERRRGGKRGGEEGGEKGRGRENRGTPRNIYLIHIKLPAPRSSFSLDAGVLHCQSRHSHAHARSQRQAAS